MRPAQRDAISNKNLLSSAVVGLVLKLVLSAACSFILRCIVCFAEAQLSIYLIYCCLKINAPWRSFHCQVLSSVSTTCSVLHAACTQPLLSRPRFTPAAHAGRASCCMLIYILLMIMDYMNLSCIQRHVCTYDSEYGIAYFNISPASLLQW